MKTIDYDVRYRVPPVLESDVTKHLVLCHTDFGSVQMLYYAFRELHGTRVLFRGYPTGVPNVIPTTFNTPWDSAPTLIQLMINKISMQNDIHTFYVVYTMKELKDLLKSLNVTENRYFINEIKRKFPDWSEF